MSEHKVDFASQTWSTPVAGVRMKVHQQDTKQLRLVEFSSEFVEPDWCTCGHIGFILEGHLEIDFNGTVETFGPGDGLFIPPGEKHKHMARVLSGTVRLVLVEENSERNLPVE